MSVYDRIVDPSRFAELLEIEALTNPRVREEAGAYYKVRAADIVAGPGTTPIMASFAYSQAGRFCDGSFGVYYAGLEEATAIAESRFHTEAFLRATAEPPIDVDKRLYTATVDGRFDDIRPLSMRSKLYNADPQQYAHPEQYARRLYERDRVDGILYNSVRNTAGACVVAFRPRVVSDCRLAKYLQFRWNGQRIAVAADVVNIRQYP